jgi:hypothetical protein
LKIFEKNSRLKLVIAVELAVYYSNAH